MDHGSNRFVRIATEVMTWAERCVVLLVGLALFLVAAAIIVHTFASLPQLFVAPSTSLIASATNVLNGALLVLMLVELAYTVMLSLRGIMLAVEPFLVVGLIATVRRMLVITIGEGTPQATQGSELLVLSAVLGVFVASIFLLNLRTRARERVLKSTIPTIVGDVHAPR